MTNMLLWPAFTFVAICCLLTQSYAAPTNRTATNSSEYTLVRAIPDTSTQVDLLQRMRMNNNMNVQFWRPPDWPGRHVDMWVPKTTKQSLMDTLKKNDILYDIKVTDWNITKDDVTMENIDFFDKKYHKLHQINSELKRLAKGYGDFVKLIEIGKSTEKRELLAIQMLKKSAKKKPLLFFLCGLHGREWLGIASCMYVLRMLILNSDYENDIQLITDNFEVIFLPNGNPDGYVHTHEVARFWRKSRSKTREDDCPGVDLNRNFNFRWGGDGASPDACDETFHGYRPFSESETRAIARYLFKRRNDMKAYVDVHTFGQLLTFPWGSLNEPAFHFFKHREVLSGIARRIVWGTGKRYRYGQTSSVMYVTSGDSTDYVYGYLGVVHSYGIELRPALALNRRNIQGFNLPPKEIIPTAQELFIMLDGLAKYCLGEINGKRTK